MINRPSFRKKLLAWYDANRRDLPWRRTKDPWAVLVSEFMLQQTRVETVIPYYERFLAQFPAPPVFARASEEEVLNAWGGLGYYSRARNLQSAAGFLTGLGFFPSDYDFIRSLPGAGDYTAAAVASIAFNIPCAAVDGNVLRVLARLTDFDGEIKGPLVKDHFHRLAVKLVDRKRPGDFNQAMMELGALVCKPREPRCSDCPVNRYCQGRAAGRERELPVRSKPAPKDVVEKTLLAIVRDGRILLRQRPPESARMPGFWDLPDGGAVPDAQPGPELGRFRHTIVNTLYRFTVCSGKLNGSASGCQWWPLDRLRDIPLSTTAKKAVPFLNLPSHTL